MLAGLSMLLSSGKASIGDPCAKKNEGMSLGVDGKASRAVCHSPRVFGSEGDIETADLRGNRRERKLEMTLEYSVAAASKIMLITQYL